MWQHPVAVGHEAAVFRETEKFLREIHAAECMQILQRLLTQNQRVPDEQGDEIAVAEDGRSATEVYVLCAEKDEKTVVICINQLKDNPQLAEDIFKTFAWIDE